MMIEKVDLVMWTKNGAETLPVVLRRIAEVIPAGSINKRVIVDDHSTDSTPEIGQKFGWTVVPNEGKGISDGANTALRYVRAHFFVSFEQDLVLARDWWQKIPRLLTNPSVVVASGIRISNEPRVVKEIQEYSMELYEQRAKTEETFLYGKTLDNTLYRTETVRSLGGFPKLTISAGVDNVLAQRIHARGLKWAVDYSVKSVHLRKGLRQELNHYYWYGTCMVNLYPMLFGRNINLRNFALRCLLSPVRGLDISLKKKTPEALCVYPLLRLATLRGIADGLRKNAFV
jgi:glycosyltransferase involved in cell wall biosynthesis